MIILTTRMIRSTMSKVFISEELRNIGGDDIVNQLQTEYGNGADILGDDDGYKMKVTCDNGSDKCQQGYYTHMNDVSKTMNVCDAWFDPKGTPAEKIVPPAPYLEKTKDIENECKDETKTKFKTLEKFWAGKGKLVLHHSPSNNRTDQAIAQALLQEVTYTKYFTGSKKLVSIQSCIEIH